ncbi:enolase [Methanobacterium aggregans]|nr:enolase [Methanobacterium aggregans]
MDSVIEDVHIRKILDSRGNATIEEDITSSVMAKFE